MNKLKIAQAVYPFKMFRMENTHRRIMELKRDDEHRLGSEFNPSFTGKDQQKAQMLHLCCWALSQTQDIDTIQRIREAMIKKDSDKLEAIAAELL